MIIGKKCCVIILNPRHFNLTWHLLSLTQSWLRRVSPLFAPPENSWGLFLSQDTIWLYTCVWCCSSSTLPFASDSSVPMNHCYHMSLADEAKSDSLWHCWQISLSPLMGKWMSADQLETPPPRKQRWKAPHFPSCAPTDDFSLLLLDPPECSPALLSTGPEVPTCRWTSNLTPPGGPCKPPPHSPAFPVGLSKTKENLNKFIWHRIVFTSHRVKKTLNCVLKSRQRDPVSF